MAGTVSNGTTITLGDVKAEQTGTTTVSQRADAIAFGLVDSVFAGTLITGDITSKVTSTGGNSRAQGLALAGTNVAATAKIVVGGTINVEGTDGFANGVNIGAIGATAGAIYQRDLLGSLTVNRINVSATTGEAAGIRLGNMVGEDASLTLGGDITATVTGGSNVVARGISAGNDLAFTLANNVNITASNNGTAASGTNAVAIFSTGDVEIDLAGHTLDLRNSHTGVSATSLTLDGSGTARLGIVNLGSSAGNDIVLNNTKSLLDARSTAHTVIVAEGSLVAITNVGRVFTGPAPTYPATLGNLGKWDNEGTLLSASKFWNVGLNATNDVIVTAADSMNMNDGYLVAALMHANYTGYNTVRGNFISYQPRRGFLGQAWCDPCAPVACDP